MKDRTPFYLFLLSTLNLALLIVAIMQNDKPSWKIYQRQYLKLLARHQPNAVTKQASLKTPLEIKQILLPELKRVDRCITCHLGYDDPDMKDAPQPFTYHPGLKEHPPEKFGCTVCHGGQGLATDRQNAHGFSENWHQPLLPKKYIRASCGKCHTEGPLKDSPKLILGKRLFETYGCRGCHKLNGVGGTIGPDLSHEGSKERDPEWLEGHFLNPQRYSPGSAMPNFNFTKEQAEALTSYMLSLTDETIGAYYLSKQVIPSAQSGKMLIIKKNCLSCHAIQGIGNKVGPDLYHVTVKHSTSWLNLFLQDPQAVLPDAKMPQFSLTESERQAILRFLSVAKAEDAREILGTKEGKVSPEERAIQAGKSAFIRFGCVGCHGQDAKGGIPNPNSQGGEVPSLIYVADSYTKHEVSQIIKLGKVPPSADPSKPAPPLYMPPWKSILTDEDIQNIVAYLWSLKPEEAEEW